MAVPLATVFPSLLAAGKTADTAHAFFNDHAWADLAPLALGSGLNLLVVILIVRFIYYPVTRDRAYVFSFVAFNTVIFFVLGLLTSIEVGMGVGFGLFAIFSVLRYRTDAMPIREMTYLFVVIALPVMNAVMVSGGSFQRVVFANVFIITIVYALEKSWGFRYQGRKQIVYERMELIPPARRVDLFADLRARTGLAITRVEVGLIDYLRDTAELTIYYDETEPTPAHTPDPFNILADNAQPLALPSETNGTHARGRV